MCKVYFKVSSPQSFPQVHTHIDACIIIQTSTEKLYRKSTANIFGSDLLDSDQTAWCTRKVMAVMIDWWHFLIAFRLQTLRSLKNYLNLCTNSIITVVYVWLIRLIIIDRHYGDRYYYRCFYWSCWFNGMCGMRWFFFCIVLSTGRHIVICEMPKKCPPSLENTHYIPLNVDVIHNCCLSDCMTWVW